MRVVRVSESFPSQKAAWSSQKRTSARAFRLTAGGGASSGGMAAETRVVDRSPAESIHEMSAVKTPSPAAAVELWPTLRRGLLREPAPCDTSCTDAASTAAGARSLSISTAPAASPLASSGLANSDDRRNLVAPAGKAFSSAEPHARSIDQPGDMTSNAISYAIGVTSCEKSEPTLSMKSQVLLTEQYLPPAMLERRSTVPTLRSTPIPTTVVWIGSSRTSVRRAASFSTPASSSMPLCMSVRK
mmetsp:Transcript_39697/g.104820  ORF Transcript_39697/g.104820 Transcript_39697/m.104820 type:complete len:244 (-) Transcript_39697:811-1542(-)